MAKRGASISLSSYDDIFETEESRAEKQLEKVRNISISELVPFKDHPFRVVDDEAMLRTTESISQFGVLTPLVVRPNEDGTYEIISGHRRAHAAELAGLTEVPVIVREMDDDDAVCLMVDSNLQRETILPSERAFAYKMKYDAMKRQAGRPSKDNYGQLDYNIVGQKTIDLLSVKSGESAKQIQRFIRLTMLIPELLELVDQKQISFNPAVELSYLKPEEQLRFLEAIDYTQAMPSLSQAQRLKKLSQEGSCTFEDMCNILGETKKGELERVSFKHEQIRQYFPKDYTVQQMQNVILKLLDQWHRKKSREQER